MALSEDIRVAVVFQSIGGREEGVRRPVTQGANLKGPAIFVKGKGTQPALREPQGLCRQSTCPWCSSNSAYFKQFYHMCSEILRAFIYFTETSFKKLDKQ